MKTEDYLHFYLGHPVLLWWDANNPVFKTQIRYLIAGKPLKKDEISLAVALKIGVKLVLKNVSDLTPLEKEEIKEFDGKGVIYESRRMAYLIKKGYDVFGLIPLKIAICQSSLNHLKNEPDRVR